MHPPEPVTTGTANRAPRRPRARTSRRSLERRFHRRTSASRLRGKGDVDGEHAAVLEANVHRLGRRRRPRVLSVWTATRHERTGRARRGSGRIPRSAVGSEVPDTSAHPAGDAEGGHDRAAGSDDRLLRDLDAAVRAADPACRPARDDGLGLRCCEVGERERLAPAQRAVAHDRSAGEPAGAGEMDQRPSGCERELPAASAPGRPDAALGEPARRRTRRDTRPTSRRHPARTRARCRWSLTSTARWAWPTTATVTRRRGTCRRQDIPPGYARNGTWYRFFAAKAAGSYGVGWAPGSAVFQYPNENRASTIWYHDHALGMTRLNVYAGPAGFYLIRGGPAGDDAWSTGKGRADAPGPGPDENDTSPRGRPTTRYRSGYRTVLQRGRLALLPGPREFFDGIVAVHPGGGGLADLEPGVLRQHDHGQRQHRPSLNVEQRATASGCSTGANPLLIVDFDECPVSRCG